jgi:hypothetical protein
MPSERTPYPGSTSTARVPTQQPYGGHAFEREALRLEEFFMICALITEESLRVQQIPPVVARRIDALATRYEIAEWEYTIAEHRCGDPVIGALPEEEACYLLPATSCQWLELSSLGLIPLRVGEGQEESSPDLWIIQRHGRSRLVVERLLLTAAPGGLRKLSVAIRLACAHRGRLYTAQSHECYSNPVVGGLQVNVVMAAFLAVGGHPADDWDDVGNPDFVLQETASEGFDLSLRLLGPAPLGEAPLLDILLHLNNDLRWTFEQIAAWVEQQQL